MTVEELKASGWIVLESVCGSKAYGLDTPESDTDIHGVFVAPPEYLADPVKYPAFVESPGKDVVYWEIGKFMDLLARGNPGALELLFSPAQCMLPGTDPEVLSMLVPRSQFVTVLCVDTFSKYAADQVKKARGLNKKIVNPMGDTRKSVLEFCYVLMDGKSVPLLQLLPGEPHRGYGLAAIDHVPGVYAMYPCAPGTGGVVRDPGVATDVCLSSIPKGIAHKYYMYFNKDAYSMHCRKYKEYREWMDSRNPARYESTAKHGQGYDAKNMMHTLRLLGMALEIVEGRGVIVDRSHDREFLLGVKRGEHPYEHLLEQANLLSEKVEACGTKNLPPPLPPSVISGILTSIRMHRWWNGYKMAPR